jgi:glycosyltransferase involved in cell wall biosynthesis
MELPQRSRELVRSRFRGRPPRAGAVLPGIACTVAPNGVDRQRVRPDTGLRPRLRQEFGAGPDDLVAVFVGGDWERKGLDIAIRAVAEARRVHGVAVSLWIVGPGKRASTARWPEIRARRPSAFLWPPPRY